MKHLLLALFSLILAFNLHTSTSQSYFIEFNAINKKENKNMIITDELEIKEISVDKQFTYIVSVSTFTPYELYINDIAAEKDYDSGSNAAIEMNQYLLGNGKHKIRLKLLPLVGKDTINLEGYEMSHFELVKVIKNQNGRGLKFNEEIMKLPLPPMPIPLPFMELEWEVEISDLPYELEGWKDSKVFKKQDSLEIKKQVISYYQELKEILNNGDAKEWMKRTKKRREEVWTSMYKNKKKESLENSKSIIEKECKGNMLPLEDFQLKFYANGKLLCLERKKTEFFREIEVNIKGWNSLIYDDDGSVWSMGTVLHMPKGSDTFEIIRK